jgi:hypothetical protein
MMLRLITILHELFSISMPPERCGVSGAGKCAPCKLKTDFVLVPLRRSPSKRFAGFGQCELLLTQAHNSLYFPCSQTVSALFPLKRFPFLGKRLAFLAQLLTPSPGLPIAARSSVAALPRCALALISPAFRL